MSTCAVSGTIKDSQETALLSVQVTARPMTSISLDATTLLVPKWISTVTDSSGNFTLTLSQSQTYLCQIMYPPNSGDSAKIATFSLSTPATTTANFNTIRIVE